MPVLRFTPTYLYLINSCLVSCDECRETTSTNGMAAPSGEIHPPSTHPAHYLVPAITSMTAPMIKML